MAGKKPFSIKDADTAHNRRTQSYALAVDALYSKAVDDIARLISKVKIDPEKPFSFNDYPQIRAEVNRIVSQLSMRTQAVITSGTKEEWLKSCQKNDAFLSTILDTSKLSEDVLKKFQDRNLDALKAFQQRKVNGMDLSQRAWKYSGQFKDNMQLGIDVAIGEGNSAQVLSKELKQYLQNPDKLFRRVRDSRGVLHLSKNAKSYHPGQGVYRSSHQNAMRLARTEINMSYRTADQVRYKKLDFIVGYEVRLSNNHTLNGKPFEDICDKLQGRYPKNFEFKGWHPQCRCFITPILQDPDEFNTDELSKLRAALHGTEYKKYASRNEVKDVPQGFKDWIANNAARSENWASQPYFIKDNFIGGRISGGLKPIPESLPEMPSNISEPVVTKTPEQIAKELIVQAEQSIRKLKSFERAILFDKQGNKLFEKDGGKSSVSFTSDQTKLFKDNILIHNHPAGWDSPEKSFGRIGNSLSKPDVFTSMRENLSEIKAVTPIFTFYMKRPANGWPDINEAYNAWNEIEDAVSSQNWRRIDNNTTTPAKASITHAHEICKRFANKFGIEYGRY